MAILLPNDWQAYGLLYVILGGAYVTRTRCTYGIGIWLCGGAGLSVACDAGKTFR